MQPWLNDIARIPASGLRYARGRRVQPVALVIHYTAWGGDALEQARAWQRKPSTDGEKRSAHFAIGRDGEMVQCVPLDDTAWHCGGSILPATKVLRGPTADARKGSANRASIGIELCNRGFAVGDEATVFRGAHRNPACREMAWEAYPFVQLESLEALVHRIADAVPTLEYVIGHEDIASKDVGTTKVKVDPGPAFLWDHIDWGRLFVVRRNYTEHVWEPHVTQAQESRWNGPGPTPRGVDPGP